jgi:hypothetical protein
MPITHSTVNALRMPGTSIWLRALQQCNQPTLLMHEQRKQWI